MATYAVIDNGIVENIIIADSKKVAEIVTEKLCVEYTEENPAGIGWIYDGKKFIAPEPITESDTDTVE
jgi:hypothetical protein